MEERIGPVLQSGPHIVERILRHLPARDILRVSRVCRLWRKYAAIILKERRRIVTMAAVKQDQSNTQMKIINNPETKQSLQDLDIECVLTVVFQGVGRSMSYPPDATVSNYKAMHSYLPSSSALIGATCNSGIIGTSTDGSYHERQSPTIDCLSAYLFPKLPPEGSKIGHFLLSLDDTKLFLLTPGRNKAILARALKWPEDQEIKCIILLGAKFAQTEARGRLVSVIRKIYNGRVALAGGVANKVYPRYNLPDAKERLSADDVDDYGEHLNDQPALIGLLFSGENVRAASLVLKDQTKDGVEKRLNELKVTVDGWGECNQKIGFIFACGSRSELLGASDVETGIFRQLMPDIPLNGMFSMEPYLKHTCSDDNGVNSNNEPSSAGASTPQPCNAPRVI